MSDLTCDMRADIAPRQRPPPAEMLLRPQPQLENPRRQIGLAADYRLAAHQGVEEGEQHRDGDESPVDAAESKEEKSGSSVFVVTGKQEGRGDRLADKAAAARIAALFPASPGILANGKSNAKLRSEPAR